jgi:phospholipase C
MLLPLVLLSLASAPAPAQEGTSAEWAMARKKIKHVFVLYQENRSFDDYFGTFPGAEGIYSHPEGETPGFNQSFVGVNGETRTIQPFRIGPREYASDTSDVDHSHEGLVRKMNIVNGVPQMDHYALAEEQHRSRRGNPSQSAVDYAELTMAHVDGDTIPFLWRWADRFVLCDHIFQVITGPSTPGNLSIIAAQTGVSQWIQHPDEAPTSPGSAGVPMTNDRQPFWGSSRDPNTGSALMPYNPESKRTSASQINLTFPILPFTLTGGAMGDVAKSDRDEVGDLGDIMDDVEYLAKQGKRPVPWGWFQEGYDHEPTDVKSDDPEDAAGLHASYVTHHNGPQYFGYMANNPKMTAHIHGLQDLVDAIKGRALPAEGVFYAKGGYENILGMHPTCPDPKAQKNFVGDDDHPGYSDCQISEAMLATVINAIAHSPYWKDSAIIITWDDSEGDYDHLRPSLRTIGPDGLPLSDGPRVPMIVLSPFAKSHAIFHGQGDQASVVKFVDKLFGLTPLADLPNEARLRKIGLAKGMIDPGPRDDQTPGVSDLFGVFDKARLTGRRAPLPGSYVEIPEALVKVLPQVSGYGLKQLGIVPTDHGRENHIPADFNPRP